MHRKTDRVGSFEGLPTLALGVKKTRFLSLCLSGFLIFSSLPSFAVPVKVGAKCNRVGAIAMSRDTQLTCTKEKRDKRWRKSKPTPIPFSSPIPSPIPSPSSSPSSSPNPTMSPSPNSTSGAPRTPVASPSSSGNFQGREISTGEVAFHKTAASCWTVINGFVYDLSDWISQHRGGPTVLLEICGRDGTYEFMSRHGGSSHPEEELKKRLVGVLRR